MSAPNPGEGSGWFASQPLWFKTAVFYEVYVRGFHDSNGDGHGDIRGLIEKLDYLEWLGIDCLWLLPVYPSPMRDGGYDIADFYEVHPDYGDVDDLKALIDASHQRGIRVVADLVMNHTSSDHPWFQEARSSPDNPKHDWYVWSDTKHRYEDVRIIFIDSETSNWTWDEDAGAYYWHRFFHHQPDLNYDNPEVQEAMLEALRFWRAALPPAPPTRACWTLSASTSPEGPAFRNNSPAPVPLPSPLFSRSPSVLCLDRTSDRLPHAVRGK